MFKIARFQLDSQETAADVLSLVGAFVVNSRDVSAHIRDDFGHSHKLTGLVYKLYSQQRRASALDQTAPNYAAENRNVHISARNKAHDFLALYCGDFVEHNRRHGNRARALGNQLMLFDKRQNRAGNFVLGNGINPVHVLINELECILARLLDGDAVGYGGD